MKLLLTLLIAFIATNLIAKNKGESMQIYIESQDIKIVYKLNDSDAASSLLNLLPLELKVEDYADMEKIFYPPKGLSITNTPLSKAKKYELAYYAPWKDVVMFYKDFTPASGLYSLGQCVNGCEYIHKLSGKIKIYKDEKWKKTIKEEILLSLVHY